MKKPKIVVVNFGGQLVDNIARSLRDIGYRSAVLRPDQAEIWMKNEETDAVILSGGGNGVHDKAAPMISPWVLEMNKPILGICYGMQFIAKSMGGTVSSDKSDSQFGPAVAVLDSSELFESMPKEISTWASHGDTVSMLPSGFTSVAKSSRGAIAAMENREKGIWGVQFHPEAEDTQFGKMILGNFVGNIADCEKDWEPGDMISEIREDIASSIKDGRAILGASGGVDSTVLAVLASAVLGDRLHLACIDGGQLREGEVSFVRRVYDSLNMRLHVLLESDRFMSIWHAQRKRPYNPDHKRKLFSRTYEKCFLRAARNLGRGAKITHFLQGTLAPDMIESGETGGHVIKRHHNAGALIKGCESIHPLAGLFKHEVRALAEKLGLSSAVSKREPFPGPGLYVRQIGWPTQMRTDLLRWADVRVREIMDSHPLRSRISQLVVGITHDKFVGVKGDAPSYGYGIIVRPMETLDYMTAKAVELPGEVMQAIIASVTKDRHINRAFPDYTPKPPGTIELE